MTTIYEFNLLGHVTSADVVTGLSIGDGFTLTIRFPSNLTDQSSDPGAGYFDGLSGSFTVGSHSGSGLFYSGDADIFAATSIISIRNSRSLIGYPDYSFAATIADTTGALIDDPNDPASFLTTIADRFNNPSIYLKNVEIQDSSGMALAMVNLDRVSVQSTSVPDQCSTSFLLGLSFVAVIGFQKFTKWRRGPLLAVKI